MTTRLLRLTPLLMLALISMLAMQAHSAESDTDAVEKAVNAFAEAWNRHDMPALGALFAPDADFVNVAGQLWRAARKFRGAMLSCMARYREKTSPRLGQTTTASSGPAHIISTASTCDYCDPISRSRTALGRC